MPDFMNVYRRTSGACLAGAALAFISVTTQAQTFDPANVAPFDVVYEVGNNILTAGSANLTLERDADNWVYTLSTRPTGVFKLTGRGRIREISVIDFADVEGGLALHPLQYSYRQDDEKRRRVDASFDWDSRELVWERYRKGGTIAFENPVLDRLSVTLAVMNALRTGFDEIEFEIFDKDELKTMRFVNEGMETLETSMGDIETLRVRGENASGSSRSTMTWFAPSLDFVPIQLEQRKRGDLVARMSLSKLRNRVTDIELEPVDSESTAGSTVK